MKDLQQKYNKPQSNYEEQLLTLQDSWDPEFLADDHVRHISNLSIEKDDNYPQPRQPLNNFRSELITTLLLFSIGVAVNYITTYNDLILETMPTWDTIVMIFFFGVLLYWLRSRFRLLYGFVEIVMGFITTLNVFIPQNFDYTRLQPLATLQILGGLYIMVRGLDNIGHGLKGNIYEPIWIKIFNGK